MPPGVNRVEGREVRHKKLFLDMHICRYLSYKDSSLKQSSVSSCLLASVLSGLGRHLKPTPFLPGALLWVLEHPHHHWEVSPPMILMLLNRSPQLATPNCL